jgi:LCP family protein required for cell wall assembly
MRTSAYRFIICIICGTLGACSPGMSVVIQPNSHTSDAQNLASPYPTRTETIATISVRTSLPTSTQLPIPTPTPTPGYIWGDFLGPMEESEIEIPPPVAPIHISKDVVNILLLGTDRRESWTYYQTDAVVILSLDPTANSATFISVPRDLYVYIPGWKVNRINTAEFRGGFDMIADTIFYNLGIPIDHYMKIEQWGFRDAVDILGGIDVRTSGRVEDMCEGISYEYESDTFYHMDGFDAMCYLRMRMKSSDFNRLRRQQGVFLALFDKFISIDGFMKVPQLYNTFKQMVETDMALDDILPLIPLAAKLAKDSSQMRFFNIDYTMVENWRTPQSHAAVLLPKRELIQSMLEEAFNNLSNTVSSH